MWDILACCKQVSVTLVHAAMIKTNRKNFKFTTINIHLLLYMLLRKWNNNMPYAMFCLAFDML